MECLVKQSGELTNGAATATLPDLIRTGARHAKWCQHREVRVTKRFHLPDLNQLIGNIQGDPIDNPPPMNEIKACLRREVSACAMGMAILGWHVRRGLTPLQAAKAVTERNERGGQGMRKAMQTLVREEHAPELLVVKGRCPVYGIAAVLNDGKHWQPAEIAQWMDGLVEKGYDLDVPIAEKPSTKPYMLHPQPA